MLAAFSRQFSNLLLGHGAGKSWKGNAGDGINQLGIYEVFLKYLGGLVQQIGLSMCGCKRVVGEDVAGGRKGPGCSAGQVAHGLRALRRNARMFLCTEVYIDELHSA